MPKMDTGLNCPYPNITTVGHVEDGWLLSLPRKCKKCDERSCQYHSAKIVANTLTHKICIKGVSTFVFSNEFTSFQIIGVMENSLNDIANPQLKKSLKVNKVSFQTVERWCNGLIAHIISSNEYISAGVTEDVQSLHDVSSATSLVFRCVEKIIQRLPGHSMNEKIESASEELTALYKSTQLLQTRLNSSSILINPESICNGNKRPFPIYKVFDKMSRLYFDEAREKGCQIILDRGSFNAPNMYDSFECVPLILIENAVKYSMPSTEIHVSIKDEESGGIYVSVSSSGYIVDSDDVDKIFDKGFRTERAKKGTYKGAGLGLHIADLVIKAHSSKIWYKNEIVGSAKYGRNIFSFKIEDLSIQ